MSTFSGYGQAVSGYPSVVPYTPDIPYEEDTCDVVAYDAPSEEPYGARGTGSGNYWSNPTQNTSTTTRSLSPEASAEAPGLHNFRVKLLSSGESQENGTDALCKISLDGLRLVDPASQRVMRIYPLHTITCWAIKEPCVFTFWARNATDAEPHSVRLRSSREATVNEILDTLTAACVQLSEMGGKNGLSKLPGAAAAAPSSRAGTSSPSADAATKTAGSAEPASSAPSFLSFLTKAKPAEVVEEKDHWIPDDAVANCSACANTFGAFLRRHHCRNCGNIFCDKCTQGRTPLSSHPEAYPVRVCDSCLAEITQRLTLEEERKKSQKDRSSPLPAAAAAAPPSTGSLISQLQEIERSVSKPRVSSSSSQQQHTSGRNSAGQQQQQSPLSSCPRCGSFHLSSSSNTLSCPACGFKQGTSPTSNSSSTLPLSGSVVVTGYGNEALRGGAGAAAAPAAAPPPPSFHGPPHLWPDQPFLAGQPGGGGGGGTAAQYQGAAATQGGFPGVPGGGFAAGGMAPPSHPPPSYALPRPSQLVSCPSCTVHVQVQLPAFGTETVQCGVCEQPFLVQAPQ